MNKQRGFLVLCAVFFGGLWIRLFLASFGYNFDIASYWIVAEIVDKGGAVYNETSRYNYGPAWFHILGFLRRSPEVSPEPIVSFRLKLAVLLALVDVCLAIIALRRSGPSAAALVMLSPVSILITGFHGQFDNLAILLGVAGVLLLDRAAPGRRNAWIAGLAVIGCSLVIKHILFLLPIWIAFRQTRWQGMVLAVSIPYGIFGASFLPYWQAQSQGIIDHVFRYRSFDNGPLWAVLPDAVPRFPLFVGALLIAGYCWKRLSGYELLLRYLCVVVIFSSAMANQYLSIPTLAIASAPNLPFVIYQILGAAYLAGSRDGLGVSWLTPASEYPEGVPVLSLTLLVILLLAGVLWWVRGKPEATEYVGSIQC